MVLAGISGGNISLGSQLLHCWRCPLDVENDVGFFWGDPHKALRYKASSALNLLRPKPDHEDGRPIWSAHPRWHQHLGNDGSRYQKLDSETDKAVLADSSAYQDFGESSAQTSSSKLESLANTGIGP